MWRVRSLTQTKESPSFWTPSLLSIRFICNNLLGNISNSWTNWITPFPKGMVNPQQKPWNNLKRCQVKLAQDSADMTWKHPTWSINFKWMASKCRTLLYNLSTWSFWSLLHHSFVPIFSDDWYIHYPRLLPWWNSNVEERTWHDFVRASSFCWGEGAKQNKQSGCRKTRLICCARKSLPIVYDNLTPSCFENFVVWYGHSNLRNVNNPSVSCSKSPFPYNFPTL